MSTGGSVFWAGVVILGVVLMAPNLDSAESPPPPVEAPPEAPPPEREPSQAGNGYNSQELKRDADGHFYAEAQVNGARIRFMVDTGASFVALTRDDAQRAGIQLGSERSTAVGAGGPIEVVPVTIDRIAIGTLEATDVRGAVADELGVSLLGQSFLERIGTVEIRGDRMVLR